MHEVVSEKQYSTIRCSPGFICELISLIKGDLRKRVSAMGFAKLFEMNMNKLKDRVLAMFLTSCVKEDPLRLEVVGKHLLITPQAMSRVLGIPLCGESLPSWTVAQCREARAELRGICDAKGLRQKYEITQSLVFPRFPDGLSRKQQSQRTQLLMTGLFNHSSF